MRLGSGGARMRLGSCGGAEEVVRRQSYRGKRIKPRKVVEAAWRPRCEGEPVDLECGANSTVWCRYET